MAQMGGSVPDAGGGSDADWASAPPERLRAAAGAGPAGVDAEVRGAVRARLAALRAAQARGCCCGSSG